MAIPMRTMKKATMKGMKGRKAMKVARPPMKAGRPAMKKRRFRLMKTTMEVMAKMKAMKVTTMKSMVSMKAMKGMKRSASPAARGRKRRNEVEKRCIAVIKALKTEGGPWAPAGNVVKMLCAVVKYTAGVPKEDRHMYQNKNFEWVGETLAAYGAGMQKEAEDLSAKCADFGGEKGRREVTKVGQEAELEQLRHAVVAAQVASGQAEANKKNTAAGLAVVEQKRKEMDADYDKALTTKNRLVNAGTDDFAPFKVKAADSGDASKLKRLVAIGEQFSFDPALVQSLSGALKIQPDERGTFNNTVLEHYETALQERVAEQVKLLEQMQPDRDARAANVQAEVDKWGSASAAAKAAKDAVTAAKAAQKASEAAVRDAVRAIKDFLPDIKKTADKSDAAVARLKAFQDGALAAFAALKDPPPPPAPEPEAALVSAEARVEPDARAL